MWVFVKEELIIKILNYYNIDYLLLSLESKAIIIYLSNIFFIICLAIIVSMVYKMVCRW